MNGNEALSGILGKPAIPVGNPEVVRVLEDLLAQARAGSIAGLGVVKVGSAGQIEAAMCGAVPLPVIYTGAALLQQSALAQMTGKRSPILMPVR